MRPKIKWMQKRFLKVSKSKTGMQTKLNETNFKVCIRQLNNSRAWPIIASTSQKLDTQKSEIAKNKFISLTFRENQFSTTIVELTHTLALTTQVASHHYLYAYCNGSDLFQPQWRERVSGFKICNFVVAYNTANVVMSAHTKIQLFSENKRLPSKELAVNTVWFNWKRWKKTYRKNDRANVKMETRVKEKTCVCVCLCLNEEWECSNERWMDCSPKECHNGQRPRPTTSLAALIMANWERERERERRRRGGGARGWINVQTHASRLLSFVRSMPMSEQSCEIYSAHSLKSANGTKMENQKKKNLSWRDYNQDQNEFQDGPRKKDFYLVDENGTHDRSIICLCEIADHLIIKTRSINLSFDYNR